MKCLEFERYVPDLLIEGLSPSDMVKVQEHLLECAACRNELQDLSELWAQLGVLPVGTPSPDLRTEFYAMLQDAAREEPPPKQHPRRWWPPVTRQIVLQLAAGLVLVMGGWWGGRAGSSTPASDRTNAQFARSEPPRLQQVDLSLLEKREISKRMLGVALISKTPEPNPALAEALLDLLYDDPSIQVRLAAVEALYAYSNIPAIRQELEDAMFAQKSPLTQMALVGLMTNLQDESAFETLNTLVQDQSVSPEVRERALTALSADPCNLSSSTKYSYYLPSRMNSAQVAHGSPRNVQFQGGRRGTFDGASGRKARAIKSRARVPWYVTYYSSRSS